MKREFGAGAEKSYYITMIFVSVMGVWFVVGLVVVIIQRELGLGEGCFLGALPLGFGILLLHRISRVRGGSVGFRLGFWGAGALLRRCFGRGRCRGRGRSRRCGLVDRWSGGVRW